MKRYSVTVNGSVYDVVVEESAGSDDSVAPIKTTQSAPVSTGAQGNIKIESPMPGTIVAVKVNAGDKVQKDTVIAVLEAMKMENDVVAPSDGTVASVNIKKGDTVNTGSLIATMNKE
jgi:biotin carboxyl carrier protein